MGDIAALQTPALLLAQDRLLRNIEAMRTRLALHGVRLRPHIKTTKSYDVYRHALPGAVGVTVSTLAEAEYAFAAGTVDILYAVGIAPAKVARAIALRDKGAGLTLTVDSLEAAQAVSAQGEAARLRLPIVIEIDCDGKRAGAASASREAERIASYLNAAPGVSFRGLMTHAGGSYDCRTPEAIRAMAETERRAVVDTAALLAKKGIESAIISVGSTPTATFGASFEGVTEVRAGVYMVQDLVMAGLGVCAIDDIALSVSTSVIGRQPDMGTVLIDAGWMALSRDRGTADHAVDQGYGLVCDENGAPIGDLVVVGANQEHGIVARRGGGAVDITQFPIGRLLRILPIHACSTAAQFGAYMAVDKNGTIIGRCARSDGW